MDPEMCEQYKMYLDDCWAVHAYNCPRLRHNNMIFTGYSTHSESIMRSWFSGLLEAASFHDVMRLLCSQAQDGEPTTYEGLRALFRDRMLLMTFRCDP